MNARISTKTFLNRTAATLIIAMMLFAALPAAPAGAVSLDITSVSAGTWEASAWPNTLRSGTITVTVGDSNIVGAGTAFTTELSVGNIIKTTGNTMIGTVASITSDTALTLSNVPAIPRTDIAYHVQGVGPADNVTIADTHTVTIAANPVNQTGTVTVDAGGTLVVDDPGTSFNTLTVDGTVTATDDVAFGELIVNNAGIVDAGANGTYTASSLTINSGGTLTLSRELTVDSETSIAGTINFSSTSVTSRAMVFLAAVTLQGGATWNEPAAGNGSNNTYAFFDDFTNNATVFTTSDSSTHSFAGANKTISGSTNSTIARVNIAGTYTNNGILTVGTLLSGTGELTNSSTGTLNLGGTVSLTTLANEGTATKTGAGEISTALANFTNTGTLNLNGTGTITGGITNNAGGTVNLASAGTITAFVNATATSTLNISALGIPPNITTLTVTAPGNTVNYNGAGDQTVRAMTYSNLVFSGSGNKSITLPNSSTLTNGNLSIAPSGTAKASITGPNLVVNSLTLAGSGKNSGTWGSTGSIATNKDDTFFAVTAGYLNVTTDTRTSQTINFTSTAPASAPVGGPTYTPTATATSGLPVTFTIDASASSICSISAGEVSFLAAGTCVINANQAGNENFKAAPQAQQSFTVSDTEANVHVTIGDVEMTGSPFTMFAGTGVRKNYANIDKGPVEIESDALIMAAERVIYEVNGVDTSFSEMMALPNSQLDTVYWLPWYNSKTLNTQIRIANVSTQLANIQITIGDVVMDPFTLAAGASTRKTFPNIDKGPVKIESDQDIVAAERVIYKVNNVDTSFTEMMAMPAGQVDQVYWLPWYNSKTLSTQLRIANVSNAEAEVHVTIGNVEVTGSPFTIPAGGSVRKTFPNIDKGPVKIESDQDIVAAERVIYKVNGTDTSFTEMMAMPAGQLDTTYWLPWYNNKTLSTQLRIANVSNAEAEVHVFIGGTEVADSPFTIPANTSIRKSFTNIDKGPVKIVSDQDIVAAERVIYTVSGVDVSFSEMMGLPNGLLDTIYWLPWYNSKNLDTQLRFGMP